MSEEFTGEMYLYPGYSRTIYNPAYVEWLESRLAESEEARKQLEKILADIKNETISADSAYWMVNKIKDILEKLPSEVKT